MDHIYKKKYISKKNTYDPSSLNFSPIAHSLN